MAVVVTTTVACSTDTPPQHKDRLRKAAGVVAFRIVCVKDLWERTSKAKYGDEETINAKVTPGSDGTVTVQLTGPQLVDYLSMLEDRAYNDNPAGDPVQGDPLAYRMYNAIAPVIDKIQTAPAPGQPIPEVRVDYGIGTPAPSPAPRSG
ncbi:hypothetical protein GCM10027161_69700 [Microbispora hainanensis]